MTRAYGKCLNPYQMYNFCIDPRSEWYCAWVGREVQKVPKKGKMISDNATLAFVRDSKKKSPVIEGTLTN